MSETEEQKYIPKTREVPVFYSVAFAHFGARRIYWQEVKIKGKEILSVTFNLILFRRLMPCKEVDVLWSRAICLSQSLNSAVTAECRCGSFWIFGVWYQALLQLVYSIMEICLCHIFEMHFCKYGDSNSWNCFWSLKCFLAWILYTSNKLTFPVKL